MPQDDRSKASIVRTVFGGRNRRLRHELDEALTALDHANSLVRSHEREVRNLTARQAMILRMEHELAGSSDPSHVAGVAARAARTVSGAERVTIWIVDDERASIRLLADTTQIASDESVEATWAPVDSGLLGDALAERQPIMRVVDETRRWAWPLIVANRVIGVLEVSEGPVAIDDTIHAAISTLAIHACSSLEAARLHAEIQLLARRDPLTHLPNRRSFDEDLELERERSRRNGNSVSLIMIDLDRFKAINDTYGHPFGDDALRSVGNSLREALRKCDTAYRLGGEEFAVIARDTDVIGAELLAERLRTHVESSLSFDRGDPVTLTASFGVAELGTKEFDVSLMVAAADAALYSAKRNGRNRVEVSTTQVDNSISA